MKYSRWRSRTGAPEPAATRRERLYRGRCSRVSLDAVIRTTEELDEFGDVTDDMTLARLDIFCLADDLAESKVVVEEAEHERYGHSAHGTERAYHLRTTCVPAKCPAACRAGMLAAMCHHRLRASATSVRARAAGRGRDECRPLA